MIMSNFSKVFLVLTATSLLSNAQSKAGGRPADRRLTRFIHSDFRPDHAVGRQDTGEPVVVSANAGGSGPSASYSLISRTRRITSAPRRWVAKISTVSVENTMKTRSEIVAALKKEFAACDADYAAMTPATALQVIDASGAKRTRITEIGLRSRAYLGALRKPGDLHAPQGHHPAIQRIQVRRVPRPAVDAHVRHIPLGRKRQF